MSLFPTVDYAAHPGFAGLAASGEDHEAREMIAGIETAYDALCAQSGLPAEERLAAFEEKIVPRINALQVYLAKTGGAGPDFQRFTANAFANAQQTLRDFLKVRDQQPLNHNSAPGTMPSPDLEALEAFRRDGFRIVRDPALGRTIWSKTWLERALLRKKKRSAPSRHCVMQLTPAAPARAAIARAVEKLGLRKLAANYLGKPVELAYIVLDHSHDGQDWHKGCYSDVGIDASRTVYMHFDADCDIIKMLLYISDVGENDGAFRFVTGSHHWKKPHFATAVQRGFDAASTREFALTEEGLDYEMGYYRPRFKLAEQRRAMLSLPEALRGSTHFGDDLLDGSPLSDALLEREHVFADPAGTFVMFDGSHGIHRGGQVGKGGERWALQIAFRAGTAPERTAMRRLGGAVKRRLARMCEVTQGLRQLWKTS